MINQSFPRNIIIFITLTVVFSVVAWLTLYNLVGPAPKAPQDEMLIELSKVLTQFILISLVGAFASFLYNQYAKELDRYKNKLQEDDKNRRDLLNALIDVRAGVEKARRNYRLDQIQNALESYRHTIEGLLQARLQLSQVWHDILTLQQLYPGDSDKIQNGLTGMKIYLDNLIDEYENNANKISKLKSDDVPREIMKLPCFGEFVTGDGGEKYTQDFLEKNYRNSARLMRQHLFLPTS
jgi:hypothetical protein